ncbi:MAG TPA: hypothetical protein VFV99_17085 [Kofleriaceae bacterium]|nr:hypothetical protein [Kofleriaceae bacterium]
MSGQLNIPLMAPDQASKLLDEMVYERVLGFIDLDGLYDFERELWCAYDEAGIADEDEVPKIVKAMIDKALMRFCDEPRRYMDFGPPFGAAPFDDCDLCAAEAAAAAATKKKHKVS